MYNDKDSKDMTAHRESVRLYTKETYDLTFPGPISSVIGADGCGIGKAGEKGAVVGPLLKCDLNSHGPLPQMNRRDKLFHQHHHRLNLNHERQ